MTRKKLSFEEQARRILEEAEERGVSSNFFFATTFKRYQTQLDILKQLEAVIEEHGATVINKYATGRESMIANPAINEYNKTATAANGTVATLMNIVKNMSDKDGGIKLKELASLVSDE